MTALLYITVGLFAGIILTLGGFALWVEWDDRRTTPKEERGRNYWEAS